MAMTDSFSSLPPFPADIPTAPLPRISLANLEIEDATEIRKLFCACRDTGFFLMDFQDCELGREYLDDVNNLFQLNKTLFDMSWPEKRPFVARSDPNHIGYKPVGFTKVDKHGRKDRYELWDLSQDEIVGNKPERESEPAIVKSDHAKLESYVTRSNSIAQLIMRCLDNALGLPAGTLSSQHRLNRPSNSIARMLKYEPQPEGDRGAAILSHTDLGSITILFNQLGGLQILPPQLGQGRRVSQVAEKDWQYVKPEPGCAVCNIGDSLVALTGGLLRSNLHRVTYAPSEQALIPRHTIVYFARPDLTTKMARVNGGIIKEAKSDQKLAGDEDVTAAEWYKKKYAAMIMGKDIAQSRGGAEMVSMEA